MNVRVAQITDASSWDAYALGHQQGLAYHRFSWLQAVREAYGFRTYPLLAEADGRVVGILPLAHIRLPLKRGKLVSLPYCDLGGILAATESTAAALLAEALCLAEDLQVPEVCLRSARPLRSGDKPHPCKVRMVQQLPESSEALLAGFRAKLRSQVRKPERDGLRAVLGGVELLEDFYHVFTGNMRDLGSPVHGRKWFEKLLAGLGKAARVGVVYMPDGSAAAAGIILCHGRVISVPWASSLRKYNSSCPNMLLYWSFLAFAADNGFALFDFGRSTPEEGTFKFKQQWGAKPEPLFWQTFVHGAKLEVPEQESSAGLRSRMESVWRRLPLGVCNLVGPHVRRFVSL